jgi:hypothetical protein
MVCAGMRNQLVPDMLPQKHGNALVLDNMRLCYILGDEPLDKREHVRPIMLAVSPRGFM